MAQFASSNFNGTNGDTIETVDANWIQHPTSTRQLQIVGNRARQGGSTGTGAYYYDAAPAGANYDVSVTLYHPGSVTGSTMGTTGRMSTSATTFYHARVSAAGTLQLFKFVSGTATSLGSTTRTVASGGSYLIELRMSGTTIELWWDGEGSAAISATDSAISSAGYPGIRCTTSNTPTDTLSWQIEDFSADEAGGGGDVTGSLAATESGSDTAAFSAASTASGSLTAIETGSDTASIAGQATATGSLAATEVSSDTAAISGGNPAAIGSMAAQEVGSDTAAISSIAPATGILTAQETGTDTASMAGASVVSGSMAATEIGSDSFFATSGAQQSVGTLAAQEVGSDAASAAGAVVAQGTLTATESGGDSAIMTGEARVMGMFAATETGQDVFSGTSIQLPARTGSMAATETGADGAAITGQALVMGLFTAQEVGSDVFFASENDLTRIRPIQATYNTLAIDAGYNTIEIDPTYWID